MRGEGRKAVFLDRDGVLNRIVMRDGLPCSPRSLDEFAWEEGAAGVVERLKREGFLTVVVTNQPDIARGKMEKGVLNTMTERLYRELNVDEVRVCCHDDGDLCHCRKPKPGMILDAVEKWDIGLGCSFMVGDNWKDMEAGRSAGCDTILLDRVYNQGVVCDYRVAGLREAVGIILGEHEGLGVRCEELGEG